MPSYKLATTLTLGGTERDDWLAVMLVTFTVGSVGEDGSITTCELSSTCLAFHDNLPLVLLHIMVTIPIRKVADLLLPAAFHSTTEA